MTDVISPIAPAVQAFQPIAALLKGIAPDKLNIIRLRVATLERTELLDRFRSAFGARKRTASLLLSDELVQRGIPPCFWHTRALPDELHLEQKYDLMMFDLRWLRRWHLDHVKKVRYGRYRDLLLSSEAGFHRAADFAFYAGKRPAWKIVGSLSMTRQQQWDCAWLRSAPIKKQQIAIQAQQSAVFDAIDADLRKVRLTSSFTSNDAEAAAVRRKAIWVCGQMEENKPTATAERYRQMTGIEITRQTAEKQLRKIYEVIGK
jgi:hypothetical protein